MDDANCGACGTTCTAPLTCTVKTFPMFPPCAYECQDAGTGT
jgi:hypothetical protein